MSRHHDHDDRDIPATMGEFIPGLSVTPDPDTSAMPVDVYAEHHPTAVARRLIDSALPPAPQWMRDSFARLDAVAP